MLGGAFFTAFTGMFDIENEKIGFAQSTRTLPGSFLKCIDDRCENETGLLPPEDRNPSGSGKIGAILLISGILILSLVCLIGIVWYVRN